MVSTRTTPRAKQATPEIDPSDYSALETHRKPSRFVHTPSYLILGWLAISVPLVIWDTGYILNRPHTMPGGWMHYPLWVPYALYGRIDHHYGPANMDFETGLAKNGFASAQGFLNAIETAMYIIYLAIVWRQARPDHSVTGRSGAAAVLVLFSSLVMTFSKTVLYCGLHCVHVPRSAKEPKRGQVLTLYLGMIEYYGAYSNVGHNELGDLILLWIIPK
jgi:hypothetical protein